jgi:Kef-type K+ transport system membrane component KefB
MSFFFSLTASAVGATNGKRMHDFRALFFIFLAATLAPFLNRLPFFARTPIVAIELILGIIIGPSLCNLIASDETISFLKELGLVFLFFQAGFEIKHYQIGKSELRLGAISWSVSFTLALIFACLLWVTGLVGSPMLVAIILPTTAFGILIPVLKQSGDLDSPLGRHVLGCAAVGELAPLILASIALAHQQHHIHQAFLSLIFLFIAAGLIAFLVKYRTEEHIAKMSYWISEGGVLPFRVTMLVLLGFVSLADSFGMETVVGAYVAGMAIAMLAGGAKDEILERRLTAIGSGFFVPLFFVVSGVTFNLPMLFLNPITLMLFFLFCIVFISIRLAPAGLFRHALSQNDCIAQSLLSSTTLPLVVAITYLGAQTGQMTQETATALVGAAIITVTLFPTIAFWLRTQSDNTLIATYILQKSDFYTRLFLPILDKIVAKIDGFIGRH